MSIPSTWYKYKNPESNRPSRADYSSKNAAKTIEFFEGIIDGVMLTNVELKHANGKTVQHPVDYDKPLCSNFKSPAFLKYEKAAKKSNILRKFKKNSPANVDYFKQYDHCSLNDPCVFRDFFYDIDNTTLHDHIPEVDSAGLGWMGNELHFSTKNSSLEHITTGDSVAYVVTELSDLEISAKFNFGIGDESHMGLTFRGSNEDQAYMQLRVVPSANVIAFGEVFRGGLTIHSWQEVILNDTSYDVSARIVGDLFQFTIGDFYFEHTVSSLKNGLGAGIFSRSVNMTSLNSFDNFIICPTEPEPLSIKML